MRWAWCGMVLVLVLGLAAGAAEEAWDFKPVEHERPFLDLSYLNESVAGETGFIAVAPDGRGFIRGDGQVIRFWPAQTNAGAFADPAQGTAHARWLARLGVNLARIGGGTLNPKQPGSRISDIDRERLENTWRAVAALKQEGIYSLVMPYWASRGSDVTQWGIEGHTGRDDLWGLLFFNPALQEAYRGWLRELMTTPNPQTGVPLAEDPAVAVILLQNEDSLLFYTSQRLAAPQKRLLGRRFAEWAGRKYGDLGTALAAWNGATLPGDDRDSGVLDLYLIWDATQPQHGGKEVRINDQVRFFSELMRQFNEETIRFLREDLGCRQLIATENWKTADQARLGDCERWVYTAGEVIAKNHYVGGTHQGSHAGSRIRNGDLIAHRSVLHQPWALPVNTRQVVGHPSLITECAWVSPNQYLSEGPFLVSVYRSLTGHAGVFWFAVGGEGWVQPKSDFQGKWPAGGPITAGQWPATALLYRRGDVQEGPVVVHEARSLEMLWSRQPPMLLEGESFDDLRDDREQGLGGPIRGSVHPLAFQVGRVEVAYGVDPATTRIVDLAPFIDEQARTVRSATGELVWDHGRGICSLDAPCAQGVAGFLDQQGRFPLSTVTVTSRNRYAAILVVSLDGDPLSTSRRVLIQVGTQAHPSGWSTEPAMVTPKGDDAAIPGERIVSVGQAPWRIDATQATIEMANAHLRHALQLDAGGGRLRVVPMQREHPDRLRVELPSDTMHMILSADEILDP